MSTSPWTKWIPIIVTIAGTVIGALTPAIQAFIIKHPEAMTIVAGVYAILKNLLPSPVVQGQSSVVTK